MKYPTLAEKLKEYIRSPLEIPIKLRNTVFKFEDSEIGKIRVNFKMSQWVSKKISGEELSLPMEESMLLATLLGFREHLEDEIHLLQKKFEFELNLLLLYQRSSTTIQRVLLGSTPFDSLLSSIITENFIERRSEINNVLFNDKNLIFKLLEIEGPIVLSNPGVQEKIRHWVQTKDTASINKMSKSLNESIYGELPQKVGRRKIEFSKSDVRKIYYYILPRLQLMNKSKDWDILKEWEKGKLKKKLDFPPVYIDGEKWEVDEDAWLNELNLTWRTIIENDSELKEEFYKYEWAPWKMTIKVMMRLFGISFQKIRDYLHRKPKQK